jgi:hypothetical protein
LYFLGLSLRSTSKALESIVYRSYVAIYIWYWIQEEFHPKKKHLYPNKKKKSRITAFIIDETQIQIGSTERLGYGWH